MRKSASIILLAFTAFFAASSAFGDSYVRVFSRNVLLPDDCSFHPNTNDSSYPGHWNCGVSSSDKPGGSIWLKEKHVAEEEELWRHSGGVEQIMRPLGDTYIRRFETLWQDRKWNVAYVCDETYCLNILSGSARFLDKFLAQFEAGNAQPNK